MRRRQGFESAEISQDERRKSNEALGEQPWCTMGARGAAALRRTLDRHYRARRLALESLASLMGAKGGGTINLDFVNRYSDYFYIDDPCLCDALPRGARALGAGKVGTVSTVDVNDLPLVLKCVNNVAFQKYLSLRVSPYTAQARDAARQMNASNERNVFRSNGYLVHLHVNGDSFSNQTCIHLILNLLLGDNPGFVYQYDSFYCGKPNGTVTGCNIMEEADLKDLSAFLEQRVVDASLVSSIVSQVLATLFSLKTPDIGFVHADLKCRNVFVKRSADGGQDFKIADYDKSSMYFRGVRFHNTSPSARIISYNSFPVEIVNGVECYRLSSTATQWAAMAVSPGGYIQLQTMYNPYGFYMSYDVYTFMFSLLMEPSVWPYFRDMYRGVGQDDNWFGWRDLWFADDLDSVMGYIRTEQERYNAASTPDEAKKQLEKMRSLRNMNDAFALQGWKFKTNVMESYVYFTGSNRIPSVNAPTAPPVQKDIVVTRDQHVCINACDAGWCNTNRYKKRGFSGTYVYDWDYCQ